MKALLLLYRNIKALTSEVSITRHKNKLALDYVLNLVPEVYYTLYTEFLLYDHSHFIF